MLGKQTSNQRGTTHLNHGNITLHPVYPIGQIGVRQLEVAKVSVDLSQSGIILANLAANRGHSLLDHGHIAQGVVEKKHIMVQNTHLGVWEERG